MAAFLSPLRNRLLKIQNLDIRKMVGKVLDNKTIQAQIIDMNTQDQLYDKGIDSQGRELGDYSAFTYDYKTHIAATLGNDTRADHITLKDTGEFYSSFRFNKESDGFTISANADKGGGDDLTILYGPKILGLTNENKGKISQEIKLLLPEVVRKEIAG